MLSEIIENIADESRLQLLSIVPYVLPLKTLCIRHTREPSIPNTLLFYMTAYLSALTLSPDEVIARLLDDLAAGIDTYCRLLFLSQTPSIAAVQAFDLLAIFAPFGTLPGRSASPHRVLVARGHIANARSISRTIGLDHNTRSDIWTWLSVCASSASYTLEDWSCSDCPEIFNAQVVSDTMMGMIFVHDEPECLAQLLLCERIARLAVIFEALAAFKHALQGSIDNTFFDAQSAITGALLKTTRSFGATFWRFKHLNGEFQR